MTETDFMEQLANSVKNMITTCAKDLLKVVPTPSGPKIRPDEEIRSIVDSMQDEIQGLTDRYIGEMRSRGMIAPNVIRECGEELKEINERMVLDLHAQLRNRLGGDLWPPLETD